jgi:hypothetical protein
MKKKSINMEKEKFPRLIISIFTLMLVPFLNIYAQTTPFFVMSLQDKEQYIYKWNQFDNWSNSTTISNSQTSVKLMIEIDGIKFYNGYCGSPFSYFGMDEANNKLYYLRGSTKYMMLDFNIPPGGSYVGHLDNLGGPYTIYVSGTDSVRTYKVEVTNESTIKKSEYQVERGLGLRRIYYYHYYLTFWGYSREYTSFEMLRFNQNGDTIYNVQNWAPILTYYSNPNISVFEKTFTVNTTHDMHNYFAQYTSDLNFNDSLFIWYYYSNDSVSTTPVLSAVAATTPTTTFTMQLDSTKMKAGLKFRYRFILRDKFFRAKLVLSPSPIGVHTLTYKPTVDLIEDEPQIPVSIDLRSFPNPVSLNNNLGNQSATIRFNMLSAGHAKGTLYDILGRPVADILDADFPVGENSIKFVTAGLTSGVYVFRLTTKSGSEHIKILVTK